jgi:hypothetical protein
MRWGFKAFSWQTAVGQASALPTNGSCEWQDEEWPTLTEQHLLDRCERASRLTC